MSTPTTGGSGEPPFDVQTNLRAAFATLKEFDPLLARDVRRRFREVGDAAIAAMGEILAEDPPASPSRGEFHEGSRRSRGARAAVKRGLRNRVTAGKNRTSIRLQATAGDLRMVYNAKTFRHPVFGSRDQWAEQSGTKYFTRGAFAQRDATQAALAEAIAATLDALARAVPTSTTPTE